MAKKPQIPLKEVMAAVDKRDSDWYDRLDPDQKKAFSSWMMMRYASSVQGRNAAHYIFMVNELVNTNFADIGKHPELQWKLMAACGTGKVEFHPYIKPPNARKRKDPVSDFLSDIYPHLKADEIELMVNMNTTDDLRMLAQEHGYDDKTIKEIFGKK
jgi:hypothetical protein